MPNRIIRDGLLDSEAIHSLSTEARWLYVTVLLSADDLGCFEATPYRLARRADVPRERADRMLTELIDTDLVRLYERDGKRYGFVPRFRQRVQVKRLKHPAPPDALLIDEPDTLKKIKDLTRDPTVDNRCPPLGSRCSPPETETETETKSSLLPSVEESSAPVGAPAPKRPRSGASPQQEGLRILADGGVPEKQAREWLRIRSARRLPLTQTAWEAVVAQAQAAGLTPTQAVTTAIEEGWAGFKASWYERLVADRKPAGRAAAALGRMTQSALQDHNRRAGAAWLAKQREEPNEPR